MNKSTFLSLIISQLGFFMLWSVWLRLTEYLSPVVTVVVWFCFSSIVVLVVFGIRKDEIHLPKPIFHGIMFFYSLGLLILLFFRPNDQTYQAVNLIPFRTIYFYLSGNVNFLIAFYNLGANIGLFVPYGLNYRYVKKAPSMKQLLTITIFSIAFIEFMQFLTRRGALDIDDLILNTIGVGLGYLVQPFFKKILSIK